ncbi:MAG: hypothetical protein WAT14_07465, partial [Chitinophagaceae bacterium]
VVINGNVAITRVIRKSRMMVGFVSVYKLISEYSELYAFGLITKNLPANWQGGHVRNRPIEQLFFCYIKFSEN